MQSNQDIESGIPRPQPDPETRSLLHLLEELRTEEIDAAMGIFTAFSIGASAFLLHQLSSANQLEIDLEPNEIAEINSSAISATAMSGIKYSLVANIGVVGGIVGSRNFLFSHRTFIPIVNVAVIFGLAACIQYFNKDEDFSKNLVWSSITSTILQFLSLLCIRRVAQETRLRINQSDATNPNTNHDSEEVINRRAL